MSEKHSGATANIYVRLRERETYERLMEQFGFNLSVAIRYITRDWLRLKGEEAYPTDPIVASAPLSEPV